MRLLFLSREYPPETGWGGIGSCVASMAPALARRGHEVHVLSCVKGQGSTDILERGVWVHRRPRITIRGLGRILGSQEAAARIDTALSCYVEARRLGVSFDVVEAPEYMAEGLVHTLAGRRPVVAHLYTPATVTTGFRGLKIGWDVRLADLLERSAVRRSSVVTSPSNFLIHHLRAGGWLPEGNVSLVRDPVDLERWQGVSPDAAPDPTVLAVGRLEARKAPEVLVDAAAKLATEIPDLRVVFVGRSNGMREGLPYRTWLEAYAADMEAPCTFIDHIPRSQLPSLYGSARVVAVSSRFDNFPIAGLEAMASGRPVVCTSSTGLAEIIEGTDAGAVVPVDDPEALSSALRPFLHDRDLAARTGAEARRVVALHCDPDRIAEERERCYERAIRDRDGTRGRRGPGSLNFFNRTQEAARPTSPDARMVSAEGGGWAGTDSGRGPVMYVLSSFPRVTETFILREILALEQVGDRILIESLRPGDAGPRHPELSELRAEVHYVPRGVRLIGPTTLWSHVDLARRDPRGWLRLAWRSGRAGRAGAGRFLRAGVIAARARRAGVRHVHAHFVTDAAEVARDAASLAHVPVTVTAHAYDIFRAVDEAQVARRLAGVGSVYTVSRYNASHLQTLVPGIPVHQVAYCIPSARRAQIPAEGPVLCVARLVPKKAVDVLIEAMALLAPSNPGLRIEIIGDGALSADLRALAEERGVRERVHFSGAQPFDLVDGALRRASMLVLPSRVAPDGDREGMPNVLLEALARGVPVISTDTAGISESIEDGKTGLLVPPDDPAALAAAITRLWKDRSLAARLGEAGRALVLERFDSARTAVLLQELFAGTARGA